MSSSSSSVVTPPPGAAQITFELGLDDNLEKEELLDVFRVDPEYEAGEEAWKQIKREILGEVSVEDASDASTSERATRRRATR